jgi:hypothetical protein
LSKMMLTIILINIPTTVCEVSVLQCQRIRHFFFFCATTVPSSIYCGVELRYTIVLCPSWLSSFYFFLSLILLLFLTLGSSLSSFQWAFSVLIDLPQNCLPLSRRTMPLARRSCTHRVLQPVLLLLRLPS